MFTLGQYVLVNQGGITYMGKVLKIYDSSKKLLLLLDDNGQIVVDMKYCSPVRNYISERD
ncbi:hypothetical protein PQE74_gp176 [Bacillus phage vB_BanS_Chewbecca]|uniref:Metal-response element-binding transcription n=3 Tax=Tsamsavirus TaxID=3044849 RepID=A0AAE9CDY6_9CAUD|nr:metal-response element-binding transcription [Bacillus phage vB_BanS_Skywalker]YP_010681082.1 metal-response element-binding transcription [Bacillus phage vB_BanS_MrDarsey]YP_010681319.1 hypothetical protein PQE74_gp176 [Bacillus phage vB_BanS_Chewbecca]UGO46259.1 hypothetical protein CHEWBECCA_176 [Bacillus phage vB_BanS_Chewbecca]UGO48018.1 metal-response element-binding transcription [Bacillus phage vB_BanS_MrDarsey]UGO51240.1 metal-response element-binding transcription [Bacillus phage 